VINSAYRIMAADDLDAGAIVGTDRGGLEILTVSKTIDQVAVVGVVYPSLGDKDHKRRASFKRGETVTVFAPQRVLDEVEWWLLTEAAGTAPNLSAEGDLRVRDGDEEWLVGLRSTTVDRLRADAPMPGAKEEDEPAVRARKAKRDGVGDEVDG
jgi:hypothetical protein